MEGKPEFPCEEEGDRVVGGGKCPYVAHNLADFEKHKKTHKDIYLCPVCVPQKRMSTSAVFKTHMKKCHPEHGKQDASKEKEDKDTGVTEKSSEETRKR